MSSDTRRKKTVFYVKTFLRYYRVTKYGDITLGKPIIFITPTPEKIWYTIERASGREAKESGDIRSPDELVVYGKQMKCTKLYGYKVVPVSQVRSKILQAIGHNAILIVPRDPMKPPQSTKIPSVYLDELYQITSSPVYLAIFDGSPSKPRSVFKVKPKCLALSTIVMDVIREAGIGE